MKFSNYITTIKDFPMEEVYLVYSHIKKTATIIGKDTYDTIFIFGLNRCVFVCLLHLSLFCLKFYIY